MPRPLLLKLEDIMDRIDPDFIQQPNIKDPASTISPNCSHSTSQAPDFLFFNIHCWSNVTYYIYNYPSWSLNQCIFHDYDNKSHPDNMFSKFQHLVTFSHDIIRWNSSFFLKSKLIQLQIIESHRDYNTIYSVKINYRGPHVGICSKPFQPAAAMNKIFNIVHQSTHRRASSAWNHFAHYGLGKSQRFFTPDKHRAN